MVAHLFFLRLLVFITVIAFILVVFIVFVLELALLVIKIDAFMRKCFTSEPVNSTWDQLLLDLFANLVVQLQPLFDVFSDLFLFVLRWLWRREEVEE